MRLGHQTRLRRIKFISFCTQDASVSIITANRISKSNHPSKSLDYHFKSGGDVLCENITPGAIKSTALR